MAYGQVKCPAEAVQLETTAAGRMGLTGYRVVPSQTSARARAAEAITQALASETTDEAIAAWVANMPVTGCTRAEVLAYVKVKLAAQG